MSRFGIPVIAGIILILAGIANGIRSDRWGLRPDALAAAERLSKVPATIGQWRSSEVPIDPLVITMAGALGSLSRQYVNPENGRIVRITILCGRHGPISVHPPTVCFTAAGWNLNSSPVKHTFRIGNPPQDKEFWMADFERNSASMTQKMRTFWSWSVAGHWQAADHPRIKYANSPFLYKIYLSHSLTDVSEPIDEPTKEFLERLLSEVDRTLFESGADL